MEVPFVTAEGCLDGNCLAKGLSQKCDSPFCIYEKREIRKDRKNPELLFTHNYVRQGFYSPVAIRKLAVTKFYPVLMKLRKKSQIKLLTASNAQAKVL